MLEKFAIDQVFPCLLEYVGWTRFRTPHIECVHLSQSRQIGTASEELRRNKEWSVCRPLQALGYSAANRL